MREIKYIVLHCTAGPQTQKVSDIQAYWKNKLKWSRPGYHHLIDADGVSHDLQPIAFPTNGVAGYNANAIHISYIGGVDKQGRPVDNRTLLQSVKMRLLVEKYKKDFPKAKILGHRDFSPDKNRNGVIEPGEWMKACPSFSVSQWLRETGLEPNAAPPVVRKVVKTNHGGPVNLRNAPGINSTLIGLVSAGASAMILSEKDGWSQVSINDQMSGWIRSDFLK